MTSFALNGADRPMPAPNVEPPQTGILLALTAVITASITCAGNWAVSKLSRKTATEGKAVDSEQIYTTNLRNDLERLTVRFDALTHQRELDVREKIENVSRLADADIEQKRRIAHLENVIEKMEFQIVKLEEQKAETKADYEVQIASRDVRIAQQDTIIAALQKQIADFERIGVSEGLPPKRLKEEG